MREQLRRLPENIPTSVRHVPLEAVLLTDAELDHSLGIVLLREAGCLRVYATTAIRSVLEEDSRILPLTRTFAEMQVTALTLDRPVPLQQSDGSSSGLTVEAFVVPAGPPRFAAGASEGHTVGLFVREEDSGKMCAFVPGCGELTPALLQRLALADALLFDGTFWSDDEPIALGISRRSAREMDHLPISGEGGSLERLASLPCRHRVYTHINNTNPVLLEESPERAAVVRAGLIVGYDGLYIRL